MISDGNLVGPVAVTMKKCQARAKELFVDKNRNSGSRQTKPSAVSSTKENVISISDVEASTLAPVNATRNLGTSFDHVLY